MHFKSWCRKLVSDVSKRGKVLFLPNIAIDSCRFSYVTLKIQTSTTVEVKSLTDMNFEIKEKEGKT